MANQDSLHVNRTILLALVPMIVPLVLALGIFFTLQGDVRHLEERVVADEVTMLRDITALEQRLRNVELDNASRLSSIETRLIAIENYMAEISMLLKQEKRGVTKESSNAWRMLP